MSKPELLIEHDPDTCREDWIVKVKKTGGWKVLARFREEEHADQWADLIKNGTISL